MATPRPSLHKISYVCGTHDIFKEYLHDKWNAQSGGIILYRKLLVKVARRIRVGPDLDDFGVEYLIIEWHLRGRHIVDLGEFVIFLTSVSTCQFLQKFTLIWCISRPCHFWFYSNLPFWQIYPILLIAGFVLQFRWHGWKSCQAVWQIFQNWPVSQFDRYGLLVFYFTSYLAALAVWDPLVFLADFINLVELDTLADSTNLVCTLGSIFCRFLDGFRGLRRLAAFIFLSVWRVWGN